MRTLTLTRILALLGLLVLASGEVAQAQYDRRTPIVEAVAKTKPAIVNIRTLRSIPARLDNDSGRVRGLGTGVLIDPRGFMVTNYHVVESVDQITALLADGRQFPARVLQFDQRADLAVLKVEAESALPYLPLWGAGTPLVGETVIAIGNPYGLENSVTTGIVSAVDRGIKLPNGERFEDLLQTDASINPGNSGGPLLNINGQLLGINVAIRSNAQNIGFAIPTRRVRQIVAEVMGQPAAPPSSWGLDLVEFLPANNNAPTDESLGVVQTVSLDIGPDSVLRVRSVQPGSLAEQSGFRVGDELMRVDSQAVRLRFDVDRILWGRTAGESVVFDIHRSGSNEQVRIQLPGPRRMSDEDIVHQFAGMRIREVPRTRVASVYDKLNGGLVIESITPGSVADRAGLKVGDILVGLHEWETVTANNVRYVMQWPGLTAARPIEYHIVRGQEMTSGTIDLPEYRP